jgi:multimeric flavodoxin WrbA
MSYHVNVIPRGVYGESSKILEEVLELQDAEEQGAKLMALNELADIIGAVEGYLMKHYPVFDLDDLLKMKDLTANAFRSGHRSTKAST